MTNDDPDAILGGQRSSKGARRRQQTGVSPEGVIISWFVVGLSAACVGFVIGLSVGVWL